MDRATEWTWHRSGRALREPQFGETNMIISAEEFVALRSSEDRHEYLRAANEAAGTDVWLDVIDRFPHMRIWVVHNKTVPIEVLALLARDPDPEVRTSVAMKNKLSFELFALLAADGEEAVRERIAYNKNTPREILKQLSLDPAEEVSARAYARVHSQG
jgi:hypothetical protein